uniref:Uncharacterized protein n=1 Tax=Aegilops tauschii subsp. strangulata TaxID=200361 RepID=A0A453PZE1_AEGTS
MAQFLNLLVTRQPACHDYRNTATYEYIISTYGDRHVSFSSSWRHRKLAISRELAIIFTKQG